MTAGDLLARTRAVLPSWMAVYYSEPIEIERGEGRYVWDGDGNRYLDFFGGILTTMTAHTLGGNYRLSAVRMITRAIYTNTAPNGAFRACNGVYNTFAIEGHTDEICAAIGMDPLAFRQRNRREHFVELE